MDAELLYEINVWTENQVGLLSSIAGIFTRRSMNIERLFVFPSDVPGIHRFKIHTRGSEQQIKAVVLQIEKKVDVVKAFYYIEENRTEVEKADVLSFLKERESLNK